MMFFENRFTLRAEYVLRGAHECAARMGHGYVGSEHLLLGLLKEKDSRAAKILSGEGVTESIVREKICERTGVGSAAEKTAQGLTPCARSIVGTALDDARQKGAPFIGTEHLLVGILSETECEAGKLLERIGVDIPKIKRLLMSSPSDGQADSKRGESRQGKEKNEIKQLRSCARDLCELVREGRVDPVIGRDEELGRIIRILTRRTKNNPLLLGDPGVGKTAVVEGLAERIVKGNVPKELADKRIFMLDISSVVAGTKYRGEFEERIKAILKEVSRSKDIILFIDEIHTIVGAGAAEGAIDAANILKPALSRREIQLIGATTMEEFKKYIERDAALNRRFQTVKIEEPRRDACFEIISGLRKSYERHHGVKITDEAISAAIDMSERYLGDRRLPDKAIDLIDEAASRTRLYAAAPPPRMRELEEAVFETAKLKDTRIKAQDFEEAAKLRDREIQLRGELRKLSCEWQKIVEGHAFVDAESIAGIVGEQTGIPVTRLTESETARLVALEEKLRERIVGQETAIKAVSRAVRRSRSGLSDPGRPVGSFLFAGPTGVGKTELCKALAELLFGDENKLIRIDMSEYMDRHEVSKLIGSPPGYVGYDSGTTLIDRVCREPYSLVLFDEVEKAHPDVMNILLQILEDGFLTDSHGKRASFKNSLVVMTSNIGATRMSSVGVGFSQAELSEKRAVGDVMADIEKSFRPELVNRIDEIIVFSKPGEGEMLRICEIMLEKTVRRAGEKGIELEISDEVKRELAKRGYSDKYGARPIRREIQKNIEDALAEVYLENNCASGRYTATIQNNEIMISHVPD